MLFSLKKLIIRMLLWVLSVSIPLFAHSSSPVDTNYKAVFKIKTYSQDPISWNFSFTHYWSAVLIDSETIITNAHVILNSENNKTSWFYEICRSKSTDMAPTCFTTARLVAYDSIDDIAILKLDKAVTDIKSLSINQESRINVWENAIIYWYPSIGWNTITRTEWKIWWIDTNKSYKFDGTMDYWNSGGAAINSKWELIWIPYAIKSDNSVIWYIIPSQRIREFIQSGKSEEITQVNTKDFKKTIKEVQSAYWKNIIKDSRIEIPNITKNWFNLINRAGNASWTVAYYHLVDKKVRTSIIVSCWVESYTTWNNPIDANHLFMEFSEAKNADIESSKRGFINPEKTIYTIEMVDKVDKEWDKFTMKSYIYKDNPTCISYIFSNDGYNKDKVAYANAQKIVNTIKFKKTWKITKDFYSKYFSIKNIPNNTIITESVDFLGTLKIQPEINVVFPSNKWYANGSFKLIEFENLDDYMNYGYSSTNKYKWKTYTFQDFFNRYKTTQYANVLDYEISTNENKLLIMTIEDYTDSIKYPGNPTQNVIFFYPFSLWKWKYYAYKIEFILKSNDRQDAYSLRDIIKRIELPGSSPFN